MSPFDVIVAELESAAKSMSREEFDELKEELNTFLFGLDWGDYREERAKRRKR